ncbi:MAG: hypothetical protein ABI578_08755 [Chloroflexota bacterium]
MFSAQMLIDRFDRAALYAIELLRAQVRKATTIPYGTYLFTVCSMMIEAMNVRILPWVVALIGLAIPLIGSGFAVWQLVVLWVVVLGLIGVVSRFVVTTRWQRIGVGLVLLPILVVAAWEGGWWLIPADLAWLAIQVIQRGRAEAVPQIQ